MKGLGMTHFLIAILFVIAIASAAVNYKLYNDCIGKISLSTKQARSIDDKVAKFEMTLDGLKLNIESLKADLQSVSEKSVKPEELRNEFSAQIDTIKKDLQSLEENSTAAINDLNAKVSALKEESEANKNAVAKLVAPAKVEENKADQGKTDGSKADQSKAGDKKVDLGEISVRTPN